MTTRVTIKDVARHSGVSIKTVSNVINGTGSMRDSTRQRVQNSIRELGYMVNVSARSLKTGATKLIGLGIFDFSQPFAPYLADKVIDISRKHGYGTVISTYGSDGSGLPVIMDEITKLSADGWLLFSDQPLKNEGIILDQPYPIVLAGDYNSYDRVDWVTMPNTRAIRYVTGRLLDMGCRHIAVFGAPEKPKTRNEYMCATEGLQELRIRGYIEAFEERGLSVDWQMLLPKDWMEGVSGVQAVTQMLSRGIRPDAIICLTDAMALGALHGLQNEGIRIPEDVQVVGFDDVPESSYSTPSLTTIDPCLNDYVEHAIDMLIERINGYKGKPRTFVTDFRLVERDSTLAFPTEKRTVAVTATNQADAA